MNKKIKFNRIKCKKCGDVIESTHRHDFKWCSCKSVAIDGGHDYLRRIGKFEDIEECSITEEEFNQICNTEKTIRKDSDNRE
ncbi:MAG: hypothetical protein Q4G04_05345 [bacterium]|nr:hypothetical protein [bacterium]